VNERLSTDSPIASKVFPSANHGERKDGRRPDMLIIHYTGMSDEGEALQWLCSPVSQVSAHYFVFGDGRVVQLVPETRRAWHAGLSFWEGETDINSCSIGIEIAHPGHPGGLPPFAGRQIDSVVALAQDIVSRWRIAPDRVLGHSDVAPGRKLDPGEGFPWDRLHQAGIGHWVPPSPMRDGRFLTRGEVGMPVEALQAMLAMYGYGLKITGTFDEDTEKVVAAFQRHFRPARFDGVADASTIMTLRDLIGARRGAAPG
jgi:N-acetylmuramoyl-L-alanine amidase